MYAHCTTIKMIHSEIRKRRHVHQNQTRDATSTVILRLNLWRQDVHKKEIKIDLIVVKTKFTIKQT